MNPEIGTQVVQLSDALVELVEEIDLACDDDATADEIQEARALADDVLGRYRALLSQLTGDEKAKVQRSIGLKVAKVEGLLSKLSGT